MGSPRGASFTRVTAAPGMTPISSRCCRRAPSPPTAVIRPLWPMARSFTVMSSLLPPWQKLDFANLHGYQSSHPVEGSAAS